MGDGHAPVPSARSCVEEEELVLNDLNDLNDLNEACVGFAMVTASCSSHTRSTLCPVLVLIKLLSLSLSL